MSNAKLMMPLFYSGAFNSGGKRMRAVLVGTVSNGTESHELWQDAGKPDIEYPRAENDAYILHVRVRDYLVSLGMTEFALIDQCGYPAAVRELYGDMDGRRQLFSRLRSESQETAIMDAITREREAIEQLGREPARQADLITEILNRHVSTYRASKESDGDSFPDFIGALVLDEVSECQSLKLKYQEKQRVRGLERQAKEEQEDRAFCEEQNHLAEQKVQEAKSTLCNGGILKNEVIKFYRNRYNPLIYSIVNYLMRQYGVEVPIRTQGWITDKLASVTVANGCCVSLQYFRTKGGQGSQRFFSCMNELIQKASAERRICDGISLV